MKLLTAAIQKKLLANGVNRDRDHVPVVKFFNPAGAATWLFTEMDADGDTLFGLCDLGLGCVELGYVSLRELASIKTRFGLKIERDAWFKGNAPLSVYAEKARAIGRIEA